MKLSDLVIVNNYTTQYLISLLSYTGIQSPINVNPVALFVRATKASEWFTHASLTCMLISHHVAENLNDFNSESP